MGSNCSGIILRGHCILQSGPTGGPDEVVCASGAMLIASDVSGHLKIAPSSLSATVKSTRDLCERGSVWSVLLSNAVATRIEVVHHIPCT